MANAGKGMGEKGDASGAGADSGDPRDTNMLGETDLASDMKGSNKLEGNEQTRHPNQRQAVPDVKLQPDESPLDSADMADKDVRAEAELNKGQGVHPGMKQGGIS